MRKTIFSAILALALVALAVPAFAGHNTYYTTKGGSATVKVSASKVLKNEYGISISKKLGPLKLKRGGVVYHSKSSLIADFSSRARVKIKYDKRGADGNKDGTANVSIKRLSLTVGSKRSYVIGFYKGQELRVFNIDGGKVKKAKGKYRYTFKSGDITFNSEVTNILNEFGTPVGNKHASAKIDLGSISVKIK